MLAAARPVVYADLGGVEDVLSDIRELIEYPLKHPEVRGRYSRGVQQYIGAVWLFKVRGCRPRAGRHVLTSPKGRPISAVDIGLVTRLAAAGVRGRCGSALGRCGCQRYGWCGRCGDAGRARAVM